LIVGHNSQIEEKLLLHTTRSDRDSAQQHREKQAIDRWFPFAWPDLIEKFKKKKTSAARGRPGAEHV
jgi:hypothetical protein